MAVERLDTAVGGVLNNVSYSISAGSNRCLVIGITQEAATPLVALAVTYGGQSMIQVAGISVGDATDLRTDLYFLNDAGIAAASGTTISVTGLPSNFTLHRASYANVVQTTPTVIDTDAASGAGTTVLNITSVDDGAIVCLGAMGNGGTVVWSGGAIEQTEIEDASTTVGSLADELTATGAAETYTATWTTANRRAGCAYRLTFLAGEAVEGPFRPVFRP